MKILYKRRPLFYKSRINKNFNSILRMFKITFTFPLEFALTILSGPEQINRCPQGHSYSMPM